MILFESCVVTRDSLASIGQMIIGILSYFELWSVNDAWQNVKFEGYIFRLSKEIIFL